MALWPSKERFGCLRDLKGHKLYPHLLECVSQEEVPGSPGKSQKEGHEDQGEAKELGGTPLAVFRSLGPLGLPSGFLSSLELPSGRYFQEDEGISRAWPSAISYMHDNMITSIAYRGCITPQTRERAKLRLGPILPAVANPVPQRRSNPERERSDTRR